MGIIINISNLGGGTNCMIHDNNLPIIRYLKSQITLYMTSPRNLNNGINLVL
jgi:hypothetical protein